MQEHITKDRLLSYGKRELGGAEAAAVIAHLSACSGCMEEYRAMFPELTDSKQFVGVFPMSSEPEEPFHLNFDEHLQPFVDGTIDDIEAEIVETHVKVCGHCSAMLRDLQEFSRRLDSESIPDYETETIWTRVSAFVRANFGLLALAIVLVAAVGVFVWYRASLPTDLPIDVASVPEPKQEIVVPPPTDADPTKPKLPVANADKPVEIAKLVLPSFLEGLKMQPVGTLRGDSATPVAINGVSPNGIAVRGVPTLRWSKTPDFDKYNVAILSYKNDPIEEVSGISTNAWRPTKLRKGAIYQWQVTAIGGSDSKANPIGQGRFYLISDTEEARINRASDPVSRGKALAEAGLIDEAAAEFRKALRVQPNSEPASSYLRQITRK